MFNLEQSIAEWRRQMSASGIKARDVLDELESHLRKDIEHQMRSGATAEWAFQGAVQRVGAGDKLNQEFGKISVPQPRFSRRAMRSFCLAVAAFVFAVETWTLVVSDVTPTERFVGVTFISIIACYIGALPDLNRKLQGGLRGCALRKAIAAVCNGTVAIWMCLLLLSTANINLLPSGILLGVVCWGICVAAAMTVVVIAHGTEPDALDIWSPAAWQCFELADAEAARFRHDFIGTEHVLLGLMGEENGAVSKLLQNMGVRVETVRAEIEKIVGSGPQLHTSRPPVRTPRAKKALNIAIREARAAQRNRVEAEHIFLGLLREGSGIAAVVLNSLGVNTTKVIEQLKNHA